MRLHRLLTLAALLAWLIAAPAQAAGETAPSRALAALAERYYEAQARLDPINSATLVGDQRFDDRLVITIAPAQRAARFAMYRRVQHELEAIDRAKLPPADALTRDLLARELAMRLGFERFNDHLLPLQQMDSVPVLLGNFASGQAEQPLKTVADHERYLRRIERLPAWVDQALINLREGMRRGIVLPQPVAQATLAQLRSLGASRLADNSYYAPILKLPAGFAESDRRRLSTAYARAIAQRIAPSIRRLAGFVEHDYLPVCRESVGWSALPDGAAWYRHWVRDQTTTELSPEEIHAIGLAEVARIQRELAALAPRLGYTGDPAGLLGWIAASPRFTPYRSEAQILDGYRAIDQRIQAQLPRLFGRMPRAALQILPEPELTRATASDHYSLPAEDGSRPGVFWAVINDPASYDASGMTALLLHEGQPGHHFQMALQQELHLPSFRKRAWISAFGEGWALYAETLGHEMGLYEDPAAWAGELRLESLRAARLVVDTGLHAMGWSREQAIAYLVDKVGLTPRQAQGQIDRYLAWPAQALGYKLGALKIQALREQARQQLGERFDLAAFHDAVLGEGALPLSLLEARIDRWIAQRR